MRMNYTDVLTLKRTLELFIYLLDLEHKGLNREATPGHSCEVFGFRTV
jgi:hypothetical protein